MATASHSNPDSEHATDHERPEQWGWHHEFAIGRQVAGWICFVILALLLTSTHYNDAGIVGMLLVMAVLAGGLIWDRHRRRTQWRS